MSAVLEYPQRHAVSAAEYLRMGEAGVFDPEARLELIEGEILEMAPIGSKHGGMVNTLNRLFSQTLGDKCLVAVQNPIALGERSMPQPDLALLKPRADNYARSHPVAADVLLVVEVADTTRAFDLGTKVPLYARHAIAEVWVVDLNELVVRVFRNPGPSGYKTQIEAAGEDNLEPQAFAEASIPLSGIFHD
jgi:Uma2 family endonuclease